MQISRPFGRFLRRRRSSKSNCFATIGSDDRIRKIFLHIGLPKTGTTSIQAYCLGNRHFLEKNGILYPTTGLRGPGHLKLSEPFLSVDQKKRGVVEDPKDTSGFEKYSSALQKEIDQSARHINCMLVSSERLAIVRGKGLADLVDALGNVRVLPIIYLRRQDLLAESFLAQSYRARSPNFRPENLLKLKKSTFWFWDLVSRWRDAFGENNLIVRRFCKSSVTFDFLEAIGVQPSNDLPDELRLNTGLSRDAMEYIRNHTNLLYGTSEYVELERRLVEFSQSHPTPIQYRRFFSPQQRIRLLESYAAQNQRVAREIFGESELFSEDLPTTNEPWEKYPGLSTTSKRRIEEFVRTTRAA